MRRPRRLKACVACSGRGVKTLKHGTLPSGASYHLLDTKPCVACGGKGHLEPVTFRLKHKDMAVAQSLGRLLNSRSEW